MKNMRSKRQPTIALVPNKDTLEHKDKEYIKTIRAKLKEIFKKNQNATSYEPITILNPIISGWCWNNYLSLSQSYATLYKLEQFLYQRCWRWAHKKHTRWGKELIAEYYFKRRFKGRAWNFFGKSSRFQDSEHKNNSTIYLLKPTLCVKVVSANELNLKNLIKWKYTVRRS